MDALLDDHIVKSQAMISSPFAKPFEDKLVPWGAKLVRFQDIIDQWLKCQGKWIYLEPIFGSDEIMKQIPKEGMAFRTMDTTWRKIMEKVRFRLVLRVQCSTEQYSAVQCNKVQYIRRSQEDHRKVSRS
eukprot:1827723-Pyramimonas_sp.AAC.2